MLLTFKSSFKKRLQSLMNCIFCSRAINRYNIGYIKKW